MDLNKPRPKQKPRGVIAMGLSLPMTDRRAREAEHRSFHAIWLALIAFVTAGAALAAQVVEWMS